ncbi:TPA: bifunctional diaminohydroxyphosphoribosylaminopyrimidine deaminase/5-amino-6-(5-phosphoribosylamino)uracil reductase RibD [Candidatus Micrarchaeota archaeon]|nr:bifunctional diaminohydroxyphosphoribosylaminopyrimidine deaminase/5-amino-6-(5-phosphoribosylamino)uracil reductase RibD [Candidatus Micrarchaeota archaeon]
MASGKDEEFMKLAISLAAKGKTTPNPKVGAIIVKDERIIGTGYHQKAGLPHAEIEAMRRLKPEQLNGAELYITLEPCVHSGNGKRTAPCVPAILRSGIKRVVCAMRDPNPNVNGKGIVALRKVGIEVVVGTCEREAAILNEAYMKRVTTGLPFVTMKIAMSLDGKIATRTGDSKWISGEASRRKTQEMRSESDAVMVGIGTVLKDNPKLTCRIKQGRDPLRIIVDSKLRIPLSANVLKQANGMVIIGCGRGYNKKKKKELELLGAEIYPCPQKDGEVDLKRFMRSIAARGINSLLLEGGSIIDGAMVDAKLVDRFCFFIAPKIIGGKDAKPPIGGIGVKLMNEAILLRKMVVERIGVDYLIKGEPEYKK